MKQSFPYSSFLELKRAIASKNYQGFNIHPVKTQNTISNTNVRNARLVNCEMTDEDTALKIYKISRARKLDLKRLLNENFR